MQYKKVKLLIGIATPRVCPVPPRRERTDLPNVSHNIVLDESVYQSHAGANSDTSTIFETFNLFT